MNAVKQVINDLVIANRILAKEDVVDAYGHVSVRHPEDPKRYFLARSLAPELVTKDDIMEFDLESNPLNDDKRQPYLERFIHGAIFEARPEIMAVVHAHAEDTLPFGIAKNNSTPMRPVIHSGSFIGEHIPVWDIHDHFGDTNLLVVQRRSGPQPREQLGGQQRRVDDLARVRRRRPIVDRGRAHFRLLAAQRARDLSRAHPGRRPPLPHRR